MNETNGVVVEVAGDLAWVRTETPSSGCGSCAQRGACAASKSTNLLDDLTGRHGKESETGLLCLPNTIHARPGDRVVVRAKDGVVLGAVVRAYILPLILGMATAICALAVTGSEGLSLLGLLVGLGGGFMLLRRPGKNREPLLTMAFQFRS